MIALAVVAYTFAAQPATKPPLPMSCIMIVHRQTRAVETRHCDFSTGRRVYGMVYLVD